MDVDKINCLSLWKTRGNPHGKTLSLRTEKLTLIAHVKTHETERVRCLLSKGKIEVRTEKVEAGERERESNLIYKTFLSTLNLDQTSANSNLGVRPILTLSLSHQHQQTQEFPIVCHSHVTQSYS